MLEIRGRAHLFCDSISRRDFLRVGCLGLTGLSLADVLRLQEAQAATGRQSGGNNKSVILIWMPGGPSHIDTCDPKPEAPSEIRGPFRPLESSVSGIQISEMLPRQAKIMHLCTIHRGMTHNHGDHFAAAHWMLTGYPGSNAALQTPRYPSVGSVAARVLGPKVPDMLPYVVMNDGGFGYHGAAYLGAPYHPFRTGSESYGREGPPPPIASTADLKPAPGLDEPRILRRQHLRRDVESLRRHIEQSGEINQPRWCRDQRHALDMVLSGKRHVAFDLSKEAPQLRERYGPGWAENALLARRLVEAGARFVTCNIGCWDDHGNIKGAMDSRLPRYDRMVATLVQDLHERGLLKDTLVVCAGEFGRTPRINAGAGRDHWPQAGCVLIAGGEYRHGQVIGATNRFGEHPVDQTLTPADLCAVIYHHLGIDPEMTLQDRSLRPIPILKGGRVPKELL
ncbi:MAG: DUF1501 domain-containing protein [Armatimonadetes bacterium]|nr:DUF1501 domain-containing protein [Armatimonadota bacterium]